MTWRVLGAIPLAGAAAMWLSLAVNHLVAAWPFIKSLPVALGLTTVAAGAVAFRRRARWWTPAWTVGAGVVTLVLWIGIGFALAAAGVFGPLEGGCADGRIYC